MYTSLAQISKMPSTQPDKVERIQISLSPYESRLLGLWARLHGKPKSTFAGQIIGARIEESYANILKQVEVMATARGITRQELEAEWLGENGE